VKLTASTEQEIPNKMKDFFQPSVLHRAYSLFIP